jgi:uncharacterized membrane protein YfcA
VLIALFLAILVGLALSLFGGGGSILSVAVLSLALGVPPNAAVAASLLVVGVTGTAALLTRRGSGLVATRTGILFGSASMVGAFVGGRCSALVPEAILLTAFGMVSLLTSAAMLMFQPSPRGAGVQQRPRLDLRLGALALGIGFVSGLLGAGGGFLIVPALLFYGRMHLQRAVATSLLVIALQSFAGFLGHLGHPGLDWAVLGPFTLMATLGSVLGGALAKRASQELLRRGFAALVLAAAIAFVARELPPSP